MDHIIAAFAGREGHTAAVRWAVELAALLRVPLDVLNVLEPAYAELPPGQYEEVEAARRAELTEAVGDLGAADARIVIIEGQETLVEIEGYVEGRPGALLVVGSHQIDGTGGAGSGLPASRLLHRVRVPVATVHGSYQPLAGGVVVVGVDGSSANVPAIDLAAGLAIAIGGRLHAVLAFDARDHDPSTRDGQAELAHIRDQVTAVAPTVVEFSAIAGDPAAVIDQHADSLRAAAIVLGARGRGALGRFRLGRVPAHLIARASAPVVVVPH